MPKNEQSSPERNSEKRGSRFISKVLPGAVRLWVRSQVSNVERLEVQLDGRDREIVSGRLPKVAVEAEKAVYQDIHLGSVTLSAEDIRINVGQVIRGKTLRLSKGFPVLGEIALSSKELEASMASPLLIEGVTSFWKGISRLPQLAEEIRNQYGSLPLASDVVLRDLSVALSDDCLGLSFYPQTQEEAAKVPIVLCAKLAVTSGRLLQVSSAKWLSQLSDLNDPERGVSIRSLDGFEWDLGEDTQISQLDITCDRLLCAGQVQVRP